MLVRPLGSCRIGCNVRITNASGVQESSESPQAMIRDGIVVVAKGAVLPEGWTLQSSDASAAVVDA